jgi:hypothetical protein
MEEKLDAILNSQGVIMIALMPVLKNIDKVSDKETGQLCLDIVEAMNKRLELNRELLNS